ncbi:putative nonribosomal peptide synthase [Xylogone sp. PMI_703]|nr:putative nonribosomal peptide synthase [Xylogone sp. PMI_703]
MNGNHVSNHVSGPLGPTVVNLFDEWATKTPDRIAAEWQGETLTYASLRTASLHVSRALLLAGVKPRANVPVLTDMSLEMLPAVIGILRVGACYVPMDVAFWSRPRIEAVLSDLSSSVALITSPCPGLQLPVITVNFQKEWLYSSLRDEHKLSAHLDELQRGFRADYLAWIIFTSGSTGKPKGVMVYHSAVYEHSIVKHSAELENDAAKGGRCLLAFSIAFDGCASVVWSNLAKGGTLAMASPSSFPEVATTCDLLTLTPSMLAILDPVGPYDRWITPNRKVFTTYGPSETTCIISFGELKPDEEPPFGDLIPGFNVALVDENLEECDHGEVMITGPGLAAGYLNNPELTAQKFIQWKGERYYRTGDLARMTAQGQLVWAGRADSLIKNRGFLINLETEVEPALRSFPTVRLAVALKWKDKLVGYVQPAAVDIEELRLFMKERFDPFVIPDEILALDSFPLNVNSKTDRRALEAMLEARYPQNEDILDDDDQHLSAYDALRLAFARCLHAVLNELDKDSSFTRLGGNSLAAIQLSNFLKKRGYSVSVIQILKLDTIGLLEESIKSLSNPNGLDHDHDPTLSSEEARATDLQKLMLSSSLQNPLSFAIISTTKYIGDPSTVPSPRELHDASVKSLSAHSIFQTRFDLESWTLSDLGRLNLDWEEVSVEEAEFESTIVAMEKKAWLNLNGLTRSDIEVPYCHVTCVFVPGRKALAFVSRMHHVLTDVFSSAILSHDMERALAGEEVLQGPRIQDFARFMYRHKRENLEKAIYTWENMLKSLSASFILEIPAPQTPCSTQGFDLIPLSFPTGISKSTLSSAARSHGITVSTMIYAAWSLFLSKISGYDSVGFSISLSGRTLPWSSAPSVVGTLLCRAPISTIIPVNATVHEWLAGLHKTVLDVLEFDGLTHSLPPSIMSDPRTNSTQVQCLLDMPEPSTNWSYQDRQKHGYKLYWFIFQDGTNVSTIFEIESGKVNLNWAKEVGGIPGRMLQGLVNATEDMLVGDLLR